MKKLLFMMIMLGLFLSCSGGKTEAETGEKTPAVPEEEIFYGDVKKYSGGNLENYLYEFEPLSEDEELTYLWGPYVHEGKPYNFRVFAKNKSTGEERLIGAWDALYGGYQFSEDRTKCVFLISFPNWIKTLFQVDGLTGRVEHLMDTSGSSRTDKSLNYLLTISGGPSGSPDLTKPPELVVYTFDLIELSTGKTIKTIEWEVHDLVGGGVLFCEALILPMILDCYIR